MPLNQALLPEFDHEIANLRKTLERVPSEKFSWKPHDKSFSMLDLSMHLANIPHWVGMTLQANELDMSQAFERPPKPESTQQLLAELDRNATAAREAIAAATDDQLMQPWTLRNGEQVILTMPRAAVLRSFIMNHLIHHRGQLSVYLRLNDIPVPALYGPSADEAS